MGIHGLLPHLGPPTRTPLSTLSSTYYTAHSRPLRLAIDISIWLFQIQAGRGGSNPALRTFYYRLLRLLTLNIHPLFVFDGPNKPLFKRHKKVGGGAGVRVASVPEFLAKQLLKHFGFPWHVAPGEAEAEAALLQREGVVDAVLSEDVDTVMFGSRMTLRNWSSEGGKGGKTPTHVDVYREEEIRERSRGLEREGMVLVALMSGGDYLPEGIPGCGPKLACDAARAGFGRELCALSRSDAGGLARWKERLQREIRTNESRFFSRRNTALTIPEDFPNLEVLEYYTHPCVSTREKIARLKQELSWDQPIDFPALRSFAADAFDWRNRGGAKKFIKNLAPAILIRELRLRGDGNNDDDNDIAGHLIHAIHGSRNHHSTDRELEYRVSFTPAALVPIDLSLEEEDDQFVPAGGAIEESDAESDIASTQAPAHRGDVEEENDDDDDGEAPASPSKRKRNPRPFDPGLPEKIWILRAFLRVGCPLLVEDYEARVCDPKRFLEARRKAKAVGGAGAGKTNAKGEGKSDGKGKGKGKGDDVMPENALMAYTKVTKASKVVAGAGAGDAREKERRREVMKDVSLNARAKDGNPGVGVGEQALSSRGVDSRSMTAFRLPATQIPADLRECDASSSARMSTQQGIEVLDLAIGAEVRQPRRPFAAFAASKETISSQRLPDRKQREQDQQTHPVQAHTPKRNKKKRPSPSPGDLLSSPAASQRTITSYYSPSPRKTQNQRGMQLAQNEAEIINLISSSPTRTPAPLPARERPLTPSPPNTRFLFHREGKTADKTALRYEGDRLPETVTKRRRKSALKRWRTDPVLGGDGKYDDGVGGGHLEVLSGEAVRMLGSRESTPSATGFGDVVVVVGSSPVKERGGGGFLPGTREFRCGERSEGEDGDVDGDVTLRQRVNADTDACEADTALDWWFDGVENSAPGRAIESDMAHFPQAARVQRFDNGVPPPTQPSIDAVGNTKEKSRQDQPAAKSTSNLRQTPAPPPHQRPQIANPSLPQQERRRSPRQQQPPSQIKKVIKKRIELRESLEGWWKEVEAEAETVDMSGNGSGWKLSGGRAKLVPTGWRKSGVEVLDLTGA